MLDRLTFSFYLGSGVNKRWGSHPVTDWQAPPSKGCCLCWVATPAQFRLYGRVAAPCPRCKPKCAAPYLLRLRTPGPHLGGFVINQPRESCRHVYPLTQPKPTSRPASTCLCALRFKWFYDGAVMRRLVVLNYSNRPALWPLANCTSIEPGAASAANSLPSRHNSV
jgi:hypothetical protein